MHSSSSLSFKGAHSTRLAHELLSTPFTLLLPCQPLQFPKFMQIVEQFAKLSGHCGHHDYAARQEKWGHFSICGSSGANVLLAKSILIYTKPTLSPVGVAKLGRRRELVFRNPALRSMFTDHSGWQCYPSRPMISEFIKSRLVERVGETRGGWGWLYLYSSW